MDIRSDYGHIWHPDSYGTQFTNGALTIAVNRLSLEKDWCDPQRLPPWTLKNVGGLLQAAEEVRASPTRFSMIDCFPPKTNITEVDAQSLALAAQMVHASNDGLKSNVASREELMGNMANSQGSVSSVNVQHNLNSSKGKRSDLEVSIPPTKKQKLMLNPKSGRPLHLSNLKKRNSRL